MTAGLRRARQHFGAIHGVIHAAGVQSRGSVFEKSIDDFQQVLDPKIAGTLVLDQVLRDDNLDFICYFSSSAAMLGDFGACDYAVASRFQAAHAARHNALVAQGERRGRAIAIHWPLWQDGGMGFRGDAQAESFYLKTSGQRALRAREGLDLFEKILSQDNTQHLVLIGQPERVRRFLAPKHSVPAVVLPLPPGEGGGEGDGPIPLFIPHPDPSHRERGQISYARKVEKTVKNRGTKSQAQYRSLLTQGRDVVSA